MKTIDKTTIEKELKKIISDLSRCRISHITPSAKIVDDLGIDSFTALEILVAVENEFAIKIAEAEISQLSIFGQIVEFVSERVNREAQEKA